MTELIVFQKLPDNSFDVWRFLGAVEKCFIEQALERYQWNRTHAAAHLKLNRTTLVEKMRRYEIGPFNPESCPIGARKGR